MDAEAWDVGLDKLCILAELGRGLSTDFEKEPGAALRLVGPGIDQA